MSVRGYSIGQAARATGLSAKTIRYYEGIGLVPRPPRHDAQLRTGGNRVYSNRDLGRLRFIRQARALGLGLEEIRQLRDLLEEGACPSGSADYTAILRRHLREIDERLTHLQRLRGQIERLLERSVHDGGDGACSWDGCGCVAAEISLSAVVETHRG